MTRRLCALIAAVFVLVPGAARASFQPGELLFNFADTFINESSGVVAATLTDGVLFTHNDSGDAPRFYAIGAQGQTHAMYDVEGVPRALDWEDMAKGPGPTGEPALYFADIGDNLISRGVRPFINVYVVDEPVVDTLQTLQELSVPLVATYTLAYQDGPHNAETLLVDPASGRIAIVTKEGTGLSGVFIAEPALSQTGIEPLLKVGSINFAAIGDPDGLGQTLATGGDISPDGTKLVVRTYWEAFEWSLQDFDLGAAVASAPVRIALPYTRQGEAISFAANGDDLITTSEGVNAPVHLIRDA